MSINDCHRVPRKLLFYLIALLIRKAWFFGALVAPSRLAIYNNSKKKGSPPHTPRQPRLIPLSVHPPDHRFPKSTLGHGPDDQPVGKGSPSPLNSTTVSIRVISVVLQTAADVGWVLLIICPILKHRTEAFSGPFDMIGLVSYMLHGCTHREARLRCR